MPIAPRNGPAGENAPLSDAARQALANASATFRASVAALREAICAYVEILHREGAPPDEIEGSVRRFVAAVRASDPDVAAPSGSDDALLDQLVAECFELGAGAR